MLLPNFYVFFTVYVINYLCALLLLLKKSKIIMCDCNEGQICPKTVIFFGWLLASAVSRLVLKEKPCTGFFNVKVNVWKLSLSSLEPLSVCCEPHYC